MNGSPSWLRVRPMVRVGVSAAIGATSFAVLPAPWRLEARGLLAWSLGVAVFLAWCWLLIVTADVHQVRSRARELDPSTPALYALLLAAAVASCGAIAFMIAQVRTLPDGDRFWPLVLAIVATGASWLLVHTVMAFHYAHRYYGDDGRGAHAGGLEFPGGQPPDYADFAYFALVIGMACQVSDVTISRRSMRGLALAHSVLSFVFNIAIVALAINIAAGLL